MTDLSSNLEYEAAHLAHKQLGDVKDKEGKNILGTNAGTDILSTYERAMGAHTDLLTGLLNRDGWSEQMSKYYEIARRSGGSFSIVMMDLDDFKQINDKKGHPYGDIVLQKFGTAILNRFRKADISGRYGGDEAIVMLTTANLKSDEIGNEEKKIMQELSEKIGVGVSIGMVNWDGVSTLEATIKEADQKLYQNKEERKKNV